MNDNNNYEPGTWIFMRYGTEFSKFYVQERIGDILLISRKAWLVSSHVSVTIEETKNGHHKGQVIGKGKNRWFWRFLPWRDLVCPYSDPK